MNCAAFAPSALDQAGDQRYDNIPASLADACLIRPAELGLAVF